MNPTLAERRGAVEDRLAGLRAARGVALLDDGKVEHAAIATAEAELDALREAEGEAERRERALASETEHERQGRLAAQYDAERIHYLAQVELAETAARELAMRLKAVFEHAAMMRTARSAAGRLHSSLEATEIARRLGARLSLQLMNIVHPVRFGEIKLHTGGLLMSGNAAAASWTDEAKRLLGDGTETEKGKSK